MEILNVPLKTALRSHPMQEYSNDQESEISDFKSNEGFRTIMCILFKDLKKKGYCICHTEDEIKEIRKKVGQIDIKNVIIGGEIYENMWEVRRKNGKND